MGAETTTATDEDGSNDRPVVSSPVVSTPAVSTKVYIASAEACSMSISTR